MPRAQAQRQRSDAGPSRLLAKLLPLWAAQLATAQATLARELEVALASLQPLLDVQAADVAAHTEAAVAALQVGDRVHQMLDVVRQDQQRLASLLDDPDTLENQDVERWLAELQQRYTMQEQRDVHDGRPPAAVPSDGVQYF